jgi:hypothetical protein
MEKKIYCIFQIVNAYDQPDNDLHSWYTEKPTIELMLKLFPDSWNRGQEHINDLKRMLDGFNVRYGGSDYRVQEVKEGIKLN